MTIESTPTGRPPMCGSVLMALRTASMRARARPTEFSFRGMSGTVTLTERGSAPEPSQIRAFVFLRLRLPIDPGPLIIQVETDVVLSWLFFIVYLLSTF